MTQTVKDSLAPQQPDTVAAMPTQNVDSTPLAQTVAAQQPATRTHTAASVSYDIPQTLLRPHDSVFNPTVDTTEYLLLCNDSVFGCYDTLPIRQRSSMFATNTHSKAYPLPSQRPATVSNDWVFATIILLLALVSIYLNNQKFKLKDIFLSLFDTRILERVFRESNIRTVSLLPMVGIYLASLAMVILRTTQTFGNLHIQLSPHLFFIATLLALIAFILLKNGMIRLLGDIFEDRLSTALYISSNNLFYFVGGLVATPLLLVLFYFAPAQKAILEATIILIAILFIIRLIRGLQLILTNSKTSKLYLFYYLCISEIVPILVMAKIILD